MKTDYVLGFGLLILGASWAALYSGSFGMLLSRWESEDYSYCFLVPILVAFLVYRNKDVLRQHAGGTALPGYMGLLLSAVFFLVGLLGALETPAYLSMWLSIVSVVGMLAGAGALRALRFPLAVLLFAVPGLPFLTRLVTFELRLISSSLAVKMLHFIGITAYREGNVIDIGSTQLQVVDAWSGLRYVVPTILISLVAVSSVSKGQPLAGGARGGGRNRSI